MARFIKILILALVATLTTASNAAAFTPKTALRADRQFSLHRVGANAPYLSETPRQISLGYGQVASDSPLAAKGANVAYEAALAGGRHAGLLKNYATRSLPEIQKAIAGYERQVARHAEKLSDPAKYAERWGQMGAKEQGGLLNKWQKDLFRNKELADVLRGLAESMR